MKVTNLHWGVFALVMAVAVFVAIVGSEAYLNKKVQTPA